MLPFLNPPPSVFDPEADCLVLVTASGPLTGTFDPSITTATSTTITCDYGDGTSETLTGTAHNFSHTYAVLGSWRAVFKGVPLSAITALDCSADNVIHIKNLNRLENLVTFFAITNPALVIPLSSIPKKVINISLMTTLATGDIAELGRVYATLKLNGCVGIVGSYSSLPASDLVAWLNGTRVIPGSLEPVKGLNDFHIYDTSLNSTQVDFVIADVYTNRAVFTNAAPDLNLNTGVSRPSGGYTDPEITPGDENSNADWSWNGTYHAPLTPTAMIWYLTHGPDHGADAFNHWTIEFPTVFWNIVAEGDSFTAGGTGGATSWATLLQTLLGTMDYKTYNLALGGHRLDINIVPDGASTVDIYCWNQRNVAVLMGGVNDIPTGRTAQQIHDDTTSWCAARQAAGFKVILFSIPIRYSPGTQGMENIRVAANALIVADYASYADAYIDLDLCDAYVGHDFITGKNDTYIQADGLHPTTAAETVFRDLVNTAISGLSW